MISRKGPEDALGNRTTFALFVYEMHRDEKYWPNPEKFEPRRFTKDEILVGEKSRYKWIGFSEGSRNCIGKRFAQLEMHVFLSHLLTFFNIHSDTSRADFD